MERLEANGMDERKNDREKSVDPKSIPFLGVIDFNPSINEDIEPTKVGPEAETDLKHVNEFPCHTCPAACERREFSV